MNNLEDSWHKFFIYGEENIEVRRPVIDSWIRSKLAGLSYEKNRILPFLEKSELQGRKQKNRLLLQAARPVMEVTFNQLKGRGYQIGLADADGYIMEVMADKKAVAASSEIGMSIGVRWLEEYIGTSGLTISLKSHMAMATSGAEHFSPFLWGWDCAAAPIFIDNHFLGAFNICRLTLSEGLQELLTLAVSCANAVGERIRIEMLQMTERTLIDLMALSLPLNTATGILAFDKEGRLTYKNRAAGDLLKYPHQEINLLGLNSMTRPLLSHLRQGKYGESAQLICDDTGKEFIVESKECRTEEEVTSTIVVIYPKEQPQSKFVSNVPSVILSKFPTKEDNLKNTLMKTVKIAKSDMSILIQGESGTGKDYMAHAIHLESARRNQPFVAINCAALPRDLIASELFGYGPGAFTGANRNGNPGKIEAANGGTLFLDEIGDMTLDLQAVLLRTLEEKQLTRIGSTTSVPVDVRFIAATHRNLQESVRKGAFREDLYYRLSIYTLHLPPLRERKMDFEHIIMDISEGICNRMGRSLFYLTPNAIKVLQNHRWKGNLRELRNMVERMACLHEGDTIDTYHLSEYIDLSTEDQEIHEKQLILSALEKTYGNRAETARALGISRASLYRKLNSYGIK